MKPLMYTRILVPVDGSENAKHALSVACRLLSENASTLYLLHIPEALTYPTTLVWGVGALNAEATFAEREKASEQLLMQAAKSARRTKSTTNRRETYAR
ncbi:universal stress protein [Vreelandella populi]|uniref:universal stress protein n=1 Tax=Vreelandella populi TaxID=2498858 RepID=UPI0028AB4111|nr:universal stress protein [Halomonas populi]